jgi:choline dehydrogenase
MASLLLFFIFITSFYSLSQSVEDVRPRGTNSTQGGTYLDDYDYIVVGSGPGGAPLAARLGLAGNKVLVIEAGSDVAPQDWNITVPLFNSKATEDPRISWDFFVCSADP